MMKDLTLEKILWLVLTLAVALFLLVSFQMQQILTDRGTMQKIHDNQQAALDQGVKIESQLDALAVGTLKLAEGGNKNAKAIVDRMKQLGVTINPKKKDAAKQDDAKQDAPAAVKAEPAAEPEKK